MNREIKFRAWHKNNNHMCQNVTTDLLDRDYLEFMQYTGLKDKNGKEIYEGDILRLKCRDRKKNTLERLGEDIAYRYQNSVVEYWKSNSNIGYRLRNGKSNTVMIRPSMLNSMEAEIIGNIYANPELLK